MELSRPTGGSVPGGGGAAGCPWVSILAAVGLTETAFEKTCNFPGQVEAEGQTSG